jgi:hypothetical protein
MKYLVVLDTVNNLDDGKTYITNYSVISPAEFDRIMRKWRIEIKSPHDNNYIEPYNYLLEKVKK